VLLAAIALAWSTREMNIALLVWVGIGGMMAATAAPMFLGVLWPRATRAGAITGFAAGGITFAVLHLALIDAAWFAGTALAPVARWLEVQAVNPYACATLGMGVSVLAMVAVSLLTRPPAAAYLEKVFGD